LTGNPAEFAQKAEKKYLRSPGGGGEVKFELRQTQRLLKMECQLQVTCCLLESVAGVEGAGDGEKAGGVTLYILDAISRRKIDKGGGGVVKLTHAGLEEWLGCDGHPCLHAKPRVYPRHVNNLGKSLPAKHKSLTGVETLRGTSKLYMIMPKRKNLPMESCKNVRGENRARIGEGETVKGKWEYDGPGNGTRVQSEEMGNSTSARGEGKSILFREGKSVGKRQTHAQSNANQVSADGRGGGSETFLLPGEKTPFSIRSP